MTSYNIAFRAGHDRYARLLAYQGVRGTIETIRSQRYGPSKVRPPLSDLYFCDVPHVASELGAELTAQFRNRGSLPFRATAT